MPERQKMTQTKKIIHSGWLLLAITELWYSMKSCPVHQYIFSKPCLPSLLLLSSIFLLTLGLLIGIPWRAFNHHLLYSNFLLTRVPLIVIVGWYLIWEFAMWIICMVFKWFTYFPYYKTIFLCDKNNVLRSWRKKIN